MHRPCEHGRSLGVLDPRRRARVRRPPTLESGCAADSEAHDNAHKTARDSPIPLVRQDTRRSGQIPDLDLSVPRGSFGTISTAKPDLGAFGVRGLCE